MLLGKTVIVTGSNRGIGKAILEKMVASGAGTIFAHARKATEDFLENIFALQSNSSSKIVPVFFDLLDPASIKTAVFNIKRKHQYVDVLINNAGIVGSKMPFLMTPIAIMKENFDVNFWGHVLLTQYAARLMLARRGGVIINISSVAALDGTPGEFEYVSSKAALIGATKKLALEMAQYGIRVNAVAPGIVDSEMKNEISQNLFETTMQKCVLGRIGTTNEIANIVAFLSSDEASYITGQIIRADGGIL